MHIYDICVRARLADAAVVSQSRKGEERHGSVRGVDVSPLAKPLSHNSFEVWFRFYAKKMWAQGCNLFDYFVNTHWLRFPPLLDRVQRSAQ